MPGLRAPERDIGVAGAPVKACFALLGIFALLFLGLALVERIGLTTGFVPVALIVSALALFALVALAAPGRRPVDFYVADRAIPPVTGGFAGAAGVAGLLVIGVAGGAFASAAEIVISAAGLLLGLVVLGLLFAPRLRRRGGFTATDFLAARFGGRPARLVAAAVAFTSSFLLLIAHLATSGPLLATLLGIAPRGGLHVAGALTILAVLPGGMRSLTWTQLAQYLVTAAACLVPAGFLTVVGAMGPEGAAAQDGPTWLPQLVVPIQGGGLADIALPVLLLAAGTASLAPMLARALAATGGRDARTSMVWALIFGVVLIVGGLVLGQVLASQAGADPATGVGGDPLLLATPIFAGMPAVLAGLVMAGLLAASFAIGQAALLSAAGALSHDVWDTLVDPGAPEGQRLFITRLLVILVAFAAMWLGQRYPADAPALVGWALALAAGGTFVPLLLGIYWRGCTALGGMLGMAAGFGLVAAVFLHDMRFLPDLPDAAPAPGTGPIAAAAMGLAAALLVSVVVSLGRGARDSGGRIQARFAALRSRNSPVA